MTNLTTPLHSFNFSPVLSFPWQTSPPHYTTSISHLYSASLDKPHHPTTLLQFLTCTQLPLTNLTTPLHSFNFSPVLSFPWQTSPPHYTPSLLTCTQLPLTNLTTPLHSFPSHLYSASLDKPHHPTTLLQFLTCTQLPLTNLTSPLHSFPSHLYSASLDKPHPPTTLLQFLTCTQLPLTNLTTPLHSFNFSPVLSFPWQTSSPHYTPSISHLYSASLDKPHPPTTLLQFLTCTQLPLTNLTTPLHSFNFSPVLSFPWQTSPPHYTPSISHLYSASLDKPHLPTTLLQFLTCTQLPLTNLTTPLHYFNFSPVLSFPWQTSPSHYTPSISHLYSASLDKPHHPTTLLPFSPVLSFPWQISPFHCTPSISHLYSASLDKPHPPTTLLQFLTCTQLPLTNLTSPLHSFNFSPVLSFPWQTSPPHYTPSISHLYSASLDKPHHPTTLLQFLTCTQLPLINLTTPLHSFNFSPVLSFPWQTSPSHNTPSISHLYSASLDKPHHPTALLPFSPVLSFPWQTSPSHNTPSISHLYSASLDKPHHPTTLLQFLTCTQLPLTNLTTPLHSFNFSPVLSFPWQISPPHCTPSISHLYSASLDKPHHPTTLLQFLTCTQLPLTNLTTPLHSFNFSPVLSFPWQTSPPHCTPSISHLYSASLDKPHHPTALLQFLTCTQLPLTNLTTPLHYFNFSPVLSFPWQTSPPHYTPSLLTCTQLPLTNLTTPLHSFNFSPVLSFPWQTSPSHCTPSISHLYSASLDKPHHPTTLLQFLTCTQLPLTNLTTPLHYFNFSPVLSFPWQNSSPHYTPSISHLYSASLDKSHHPTALLQFLTCTQLPLTNLTIPLHSFNFSPVLSFPWQTSPPHCTPSISHLYSASLDKPHPPTTLLPFSPVLSFPWQNSSPHYTPSISHLYSASLDKPHPPTTLLPFSPVLSFPWQTSSPTTLLPFSPVLSFPWQISPPHYTTSISHLYSASLDKPHPPTTLLQFLTCTQLPLTNLTTPLHYFNFSPVLSFPWQTSSPHYTPPFLTCTQLPLTNLIPHYTPSISHLYSASLDKPHHPTTLLQFLTCTQLPLTNLTTPLHSFNFSPVLSFPWQTSPPHYTPPLLTCTQLPNPWRSSSWWYTSW